MKLKFGVFPLAKEEKNNQVRYSKAEVGISKIRKLDGRSRIKILLVLVFLLAEFFFEDWFYHIRFNRWNKALSENI